MSETQQLLLVGWAGALGLVVGSFLNVCIFRLPRDCMSVVKPRSRCPKCLRFIAWYDNLPVASWIALGGRCRHCRVPISPRYPLVELLTGALYAWAAWGALVDPPRPLGEAGAIFLVEAGFIGALIVCAFIDLDLRILPDEVTKPGIAAGLAFAFAFPWFLPLFGELAEPLRLVHLATGGHDPLRDGTTAAAAFRRVARFESEYPRLGSLAASGLGAAVGFGVIWAVGMLGKILFRKRIARLGETEAMGFGDVKYMAMMGAVLGWKGILLTLVVACFAGAVFGLVKLAVLRRMGFAPFGPFLSIGALSMLLGSSQVDAAIRLYLDGTHRFSRWLFSP